jgi:hypothetical protein
MSSVDGQSAPRGSPSSKPVDLGLQNLSKGDRRNAAAFAIHAGVDGTAMTVEDHRR